MKKQSNPLQPLIDELHKNKKLHSEIAENYKNNAKSHTDYEQYFYNLGIENGFKQAIEMLAKFNFWNDARTNPPKFDVRRAYPNRPDFLVVIRNSNGAIQTDVYPYRFEKGEWVVPKSFEVLYWQELLILPKSLLK